MRHTELDLDPFNGGSANGYNGKFTLQLPPGVTYKAIVMYGNNLNNDQVRRITITLNGDVIYDASGEVLRMIQQYKKLGVSGTIEDGVWIIPFSDFTMATQDGQNLSNLVTLPNENVIFQVETEAATQAQQTSNNVASIECTAILGVTRTAREAIPRLYTDVLNGGVAGENKYRNFVNQNKTSNPVFIRRMHIDDSSVNKLEIKRNEITLFEKKKRANNYELRNIWSKQPQAGWFHFDPVKTEFGAVDALNTSSGSFEIITTKSAVGDFRAVFEVVELLPQPRS